MNALNIIKYIFYLEYYLTHINCYYNITGIKFGDFITKRDKLKNIQLHKLHRNIINSIIKDK